MPRYRPRRVRHAARRVVDGVGGAELTDEHLLVRTSRRYDVKPACCRELDDERTDAPRRAHDEDDIVLVAIDGLEQIERGRAGQGQAAATWKSIAAGL